MGSMRRQNVFRTLVSYYSLYDVSAVPVVTPLAGSQFMRGSVSVVLKQGIV